MQLVQGFQVSFQSHCRDFGANSIRVHALPQFRVVAHIMFDIAPPTGHAAVRIVVSVQESSLARPRRRVQRPGWRQHRVAMSLPAR